ncbi:MAG: hypothetical protein J6N15_04205 [Ruminiclostridium sp.]|nr:hypothetical protein [Ruminiclostridium sp.]
MTRVESDIILCVVNALKEITPNVYFGKSHTVYPKINCDLRLFGEDDERCRYRLVLDYYAADSKPITVVHMSETVRDMLNHGQAYTEDGALITFRKDGSGGLIDDPHEKIVHYKDAYEVSYWKNFDT